MRFILASKSPSRLELLRRAGLDPEVHASDVDESLVTDSQPVRLALRLAAAQGESVAANEARQALRTASTVVKFADITDEEITAYVARGEPRWVAGAFTIDGLGGAFVTGIEGDPHNVIGLSLPLLRQILLDLGVTWPSLWRGGTET